MSKRDWPKGAWSHSRWQTLRRCPKAHHLKYVERIYPIGEKPEALLIGSMFHFGMEVITDLARRGSQTTPLEWSDAAKQAAALTRKEVERQGRVFDPKTILEGFRLLAVYPKIWGYENAGFGKHTIHASEMVLKGGDLHAALGGFASIADAVTEFNGQLYVWEHKTAGRMPSGDSEADKIRDLKSRPQYAALAFCAREHYGKLPIVVHSVTTKTKVVGSARFDIHFTHEELDQWAAEQQELESMVNLKCANRDACAPPVGFRCDYFNHCHGSDEQREKLYAAKE